MSEPSPELTETNQKDWSWDDFGPDHLVDDSYVAEVGEVVADGSQTDGVE